MKNTAAILSSLLLASGITAAPFQPDAHTLLLSGFDNGVERADYSVGPAEFLGIGATQAKGYYGKGLDVRCRYADAAQCGKTSARSAIFSRWALLMHGNTTYDEGTFEFFINVRDNTGPALDGSGLINGFVARIIDDDKYYLGPFMSLTTRNLIWRFPLWSTDTHDQWSGSFRFAKPLKKGWHHMAIVWAKGEAVIYLDGRVVETCDLKGKLGLLLLNNLSHGLCMSGFVLDELRISDIARYRSEFEPNWRDGKRPLKAFSGNPEAKRYEASYRTPQQAPEQLGIGLQKAGIPAALTVQSGLERKEYQLKKQSFSRNGFEFLLTDPAGNDLVLSGSSRSLPSGSRELPVTFRNAGKADQKIETSLGVPLPKDAEEYFDGLEKRQFFPFPRYRDSYAMVLPLAGWAKGRKIVSVGLSPRFPYNDLIHAARPGTGMWAGTRFVLAPGEKFTVVFHLAETDSRFRTAAALERYYEDYADLYRPRPGNSLYDTLPVTNHWRSDPPRDIQRQGSSGSYWGHGPYHTKGDGSGRWWNMEKYRDDFSYKHAANWEKTMGNDPRNIAPAIALETKYEFDLGTGVRRYHATPDLTPAWIIKEADPALTPVDDPLSNGHYYKKINGNCFVNEYNTPLGNIFLEETETYLKNCRSFSPGFINDVIYADTVMRFFDPVAQKTPGRSYSADRGYFVRGAMGKQRRWEFTGKLPTRGKAVGNWVADGGSFSYTLGAYSCQSAIESGELYTMLAGLSYVKYARQLHGEKSITGNSEVAACDFARYIDVQTTTPKQLRDILRFAEKQLILYSLENAVFADPGSYSAGKQQMIEAAPLMTEAILRGRRAVPGGEVNSPLWFRRSGRGCKTLLVVGNRTGTAQQGTLKLAPECFGGLPVPARFMGGKAAIRGDIEQVEMKFKVPGASPEAWLAPLVLKDPGKCSVETEFTGDGLQFTLTADITAEKETAFEIDDFAPLYQMTVTVNGKKTGTVPAGKSVLKAQYRCAACCFTAADLAAVELFKDGKVNFRIVADPGWHCRWLYYNFNIGFDRGTAGLLESFVRCCDYENGVYGDMGMPEWKRGICDPGYTGWYFVLKSSGKKNAVSIDPSRRLIEVTGTTPGEARRAMMVLLRALDRRYPHVGSIIPLRYRGVTYGKGNPWLMRPQDKRCKAFNKRYSAQNFFGQPLLKSEYEGLYTADADFFGKYRMEYPPFFAEPLYGDDFVHSYQGEDAEWLKFINSLPGIKRNELPQ